MTILLSITPYLLSLILGYGCLRLMFDKDDPLDPLVEFFLAGGLGLAISSLIVFFDLLLFDQLGRVWIITAHVALLIFLLYRLYSGGQLTSMLPSKHTNRKTLFPYILVVIMTIPLWLYPQVFPHGGWDAWSAWNLKARYVFMGGDYWKSMFDPVLWRSSPHYPLLLPLVNVWGWLFINYPEPSIPGTTATIFTILTAGLLFAGLRDLTKKNLSIIAALLLTTSPFFLQISTSQYCEIVIAYYLLGSIFCLVAGQLRNNKSYTILSGLFLGFLSFAKSEASMVTAIIVFLAIPYFFWADKSKKQSNQQHLIYFLAAVVLAVIPTILFELMYSPGNQSFVNGLTSAEKPSDIHRLKLSLAFLLMELKSAKWNGIWIFMGVGLILSKGRCFYRPLRIIPLFLFSYLFILCFYYYLNTFFEIAWWLQVTLNRVLLAILPTFIFWVLCSLWMEKDTKPTST